MQEVTNPEILKQLNSDSGMREVTDPAILEQLNTPEKPYLQKVGEDILSPITSGYEVGKNLIPAIKGIINASTDYRSVANTPEENTLATAYGLNKEVVPVVKEMAKGTIKDIGNIVTHPWERPLSFAMLAEAPLQGIKSLSKDGIKSAVKEVVEQAPKEARNMIDTAEVIPFVKLEKTNIQNLAGNKYVQDNLMNFTGDQVAEAGERAAKSTLQVKPAIREAQSKFYAKLGIKDSDTLNATETLKNIRREIDENSKYLDATHIEKANRIYDDLVSGLPEQEIESVSHYAPGSKTPELKSSIIDLISSDNKKVPDLPLSRKLPTNNIEYAENQIKLQNMADREKFLQSKKPIAKPLPPKPPEGDLQFGKVKNVARDVYELADENRNEVGTKTMAGKFFDRIGNELTALKRTDPRIAKAGNQYSDLLEAEKLINKILRLNRELGENRLEGKIFSTTKDKANTLFKERLQKVEDILKKYDETKDIVGYGGFTDKIKLAQIANDISTRKAIIPASINRFIGMAQLKSLTKVFDPEFQVLYLNKLIKEGKINAKQIESGMTEINPRLIGGKTITRYNALRDILKKGK